MLIHTMCSFIHACGGIETGLKHQISDLQSSIHCIKKEHDDEMIAYKTENVDFKNKIQLNEESINDLTIKNTTLGNQMMDKKMKMVKLEFENEDYTHRLKESETMKQNLAIEKGKSPTLLDIIYV